MVNILGNFPCCHKVEKPGAVVLFEDPEKKSNTIGVVVNPVRIRSLTDFGSLDDVAVRVINAEKKKVGCYFLFNLQYVTFFTYKNIRKALKVFSFLASLSEKQVGMYLCTP